MEICILGKFIYSIALKYANLLKVLQYSMQIYLQYCIKVQ